MNRIILPGAALIGALALMLSACSTPEGDAAKGERWYRMHNCFACHGDLGNDGKAPNLKDPDLGYRAFISAVRDAGSPIMPKYSEEKIPDQDVADIYAWLHGS